MFIWLDYASGNGCSVWGVLVSELWGGQLSPRGQGACPEGASLREDVSGPLLVMDAPLSPLLLLHFQQQQVPPWG